MVLQNEYHNLGSVRKLLEIRKQNKTPLLGNTIYNMLFIMQKDKFNMFRLL